MALLTYGEGITIKPATTVLKRSFISNFTYGYKLEFSNSLTLPVTGEGVKPVYCEMLTVHPMKVERSFVSTVEYDTDYRDVSFMTSVLMMERKISSKLSAREMWDLVYEVAYRYIDTSETDSHEKLPPLE